MTTMDTGPNNPWSADAYAAPERRGNVAGVVGFIVSLVGLLCTLGLLAPIGMLISVVGLFGKNKPKGFAIAGTIIGLIGTLFAVVIGGGIVWALLAGRAMVQSTVGLGLGLQQLQEHVQQTGSLPDKATLESLINQQLQDVPAWLGGGALELPFEYEPLPDGKVRLTFPGQDEQFGTADDVSEEIDLSGWLNAMQGPDGPDTSDAPEVPAQP
jgi:hypothetical protein